MPWRATQVGIPSFVRIKPGALRRIGIYAKRHAYRSLTLFHSSGLPSSITTPVAEGLRSAGAAPVRWVEVRDATFEAAADLLAELPADCDAVLGLGGGKCLDVAKYVAGLAGKPYYAAPTSLSNDGFCSPQSSLLLQGRRKSLPIALPYGVVVDTEACLHAPDVLWLSGVGDLVAKLTAVHDWKLAYHACGEPVDDLAALLSNATVYQFIARPSRDHDGMQLLATSLMLSGIAMAMCGSSRPASGAEHLISHAFDNTAASPKVHGLQVGLASYMVSRLQGENTELIAGVFDRTGFWQAIRNDPFSRREWLHALELAPSIKPDRYTILSSSPRLEEVVAMMDTDTRLDGCFVD